MTTAHTINDCRSLIWSITIQQIVFSWFLPLFLNTSDWFLYSWDILFHCNLLGYQMEKRPFSIFPNGKMLSLEKGLFPLEIQVECSERPSCKKVLLQRMPETFWSVNGFAGLFIGNIETLKCKSPDNLLSDIQRIVIIRKYLSVGIF